jgi:hypothetical protein
MAVENNDLHGRLRLPREPTRGLSQRWRSNGYTRIGLSPALQRLCRQKEATAWVTNLFGAGTVQGTVAGKKKKDLSVVESNEQRCPSPDRRDWRAVLLHATRQIGKVPARNPYSLYEPWSSATESRPA